METKHTVQYMLIWWALLIIYNGGTGSLMLELTVIYWFTYLKCFGVLAGKNAI